MFELIARSMQAVLTLTLAACLIDVLGMVAGILVFIASTVSIAVLAH